MADILVRRTAYIENWNGSIRSTGWATVNTPIGTCVEPFVPFRTYAEQTVSANTTFDPKDDMAIVTDLELVDSTSLGRNILGGDSSISLHGGNVMHPRVGR